MLLIDHQQSLSHNNLIYNIFICLDCFRGPVCGPVFSRLPIDAFCVILPLHDDLTRQDEHLIQFCISPPKRLGHSDDCRRYAPELTSRVPRQLD